MYSAVCQKDLTCIIWTMIYTCNCFNLWVLAFEARCWFFNLRLFSRLNSHFSWSKSSSLSRTTWGKLRKLLSIISVFLAEFQMSSLPPRVKAGWKHKIIHKKNTCHCQEKDENELCLLMRRKKWIFKNASIKIYIFGTAHGIYLCDWHDIIFLLQIRQNKTCDLTQRQDVRTVGVRVGMRGAQSEEPNVLLLWVWPGMVTSAS